MPWRNAQSEILQHISVHSAHTLLTLLYFILHVPPPSPTGYPPHTCSVLIVQIVLYGVELSAAVSAVNKIKEIIITGRNYTT
jgi:hypothetical protein